MTERVPIYMQCAAYAREHDELSEYRASHQANVACRNAIDAAISKHYRNNILHDEAMHEVIAEFGFERTLYVLANTIQYKLWDGRFSPANKVWAEDYPVVADVVPGGEDHTIDFIANSHPCLLNGFVSQVRKAYALSQQATQGPQMGMM